MDNGSVANQAYAHMTDPDGNEITGQNSFRVDAVRSPAISIDKVASTDTITAVGQVVTYTITTQNTGNVTIGNVVITDPLPRLSTLNCDKPGPVTLAPGETKECTATYTVDQTDLDRGTVLNTSTVTGTRPTGDAIRNTDGETVTAQTTTGLELTKTASAARVQNAGDTITYTFDIRNTGTISVNNVQLTDPMAGLGEFVCTPALGSTLAPDAVLHCTADKVVTPDEMNLPTLDNTAVATATAADGTALTSQDSAQVIPVHQPRLSLEKTAAPVTFDDVDQTITYTFVVTNTGNARSRSSTPVT